MERTEFRVSMSSSKKHHGLRNPAAELTFYLQEANQKHNDLKVKHENLISFWENTYNELYNSYLTLQNSLLCQSCKSQMATVEEGRTVELCHTCTQLTNGKGQRL